MKIQDLRDRRQTALDAMDAITALAKGEDRDITAEEQEAIDGHLDSIDGITAEIKAFEAQIDRENRMTMARENARRPMPRKAPSDSATALDIRMPDEPWMKSWGTLKAYEDNPAGRRSAYAAGSWFLAAVNGDPQSREWCETNGIPMRSAMSEGVNSAGGFLVPDEMANRVIYLRDQFGDARRECTIEPMISDTKLVPTQTGNVTIYYPGEGSEITASDQTWSQVQLTARKAAALLRYSTELGEDSIVGIGDRVTMDMGIGFAEAEDDAWLNGDGTNTYGGITGVRASLIDGTHTVSAVEATAGDNLLPEITMADLHKLAGTLPQYAIRGGNVKWYGSQYLWEGVIVPLIYAAGGRTVEETVNGTTRRALLGFEYVTTSKMPSSSTADYDTVVMVLLGDMKMGCMLGSRRPMTMAVLRERYAEFDQIGIVATERYDIAPHGLGDTSVAGPIVGLYGNVA